MRLFSVLSMLLLICLAGYTQTTVSTKVVDFGTLMATTQRYADISIRNPGKDKVYLLRVEHSPEVVYRINSESILPDSTFTLRFQVNPKQKGSFNYVIRVFLSDQDEPIEMRLKGKVDEIPEYGNNSLTKCPDFNARPIQKKQGELTIITVDKETGVPLSRSSVAIIRNGIPAGAWITGRNGLFKTAVPSGFFYFIASHEGYLLKEAGVYVSPEISEITIPLVKDPNFKEPIIKENVPDEIVELNPKEAATITNEQLKKEQTDSVIQKERPELTKLPLDNFDTSYFKDINVAFVLDISSSMKLGEKMDLLKYSLNQLVTQLRTEDLMTLVTYSDDAQVFQPPTNGNKKDELQNAIEQLKPMGLTAGGKGIKLGYKQVMLNYDATKTNMVIVITDGAFNKDSDNYQKLVLKYAKKGVIFSVVGIQAKDKDAILMEEAAKVGDGRYIPIKKLLDAQYNLLQELRIASFKK